jgi:Protein of unknown function (DUF1554)
MTLVACSGSDPTIINGPKANTNSTPDGGTVSTSSDGGTNSHTDSGTSTTSGQKRVFITSVTYSGNLGGLSGADQKCTLAAQGANLGGSWKAWLSSGNSAAIDRIADVGPWYSIDGKKVFNNKANLTTIPLSPIEKTEQNTYQLGNVWTGSEQGGTPSGDDCSAWTVGDDQANGAIGTPAEHQSAGWGGQSPAQAWPCSFSQALICFEQ